MQATAVGDDELLRAKALLLRQIPLAEASVDGIAHGLIDRREYDLPLDEPDARRAALHRHDPRRRAGGIPEMAAARRPGAGVAGACAAMSAPCISIVRATPISDRFNGKPVPIE